MYKKLLEKGVYLGTDGCKGGWITAVLDLDGLRIEKFPTIAGIIKAQIAGISMHYRYMYYM